MIEGQLIFYSMVCIVFLWEGVKMLALKCLRKYDKR